MPSSMLVHDTRLEGTAPAVAPNTFRVNATTPIADAFGWISTYARRNGGLTDLLIMCHGLAGGVHDTRVGLSTTTLGFGLQLCRENLTFANVASTSVLNNLVQVITLYACGPARTRAGFEFTVADGRRFCMELAAYTNAEVVAAVETQWYHRRPPESFFRRLLSIGPQDTIDFGAWEGQVNRFSPDGSVRAI